MKLTHVFLAFAVTAFVLFVVLDVTTGGGAFFDLLIAAAKGFWHFIIGLLKKMRDILSEYNFHPVNNMMKII